MKKGPGQKHQDVKEIIATELEDGDVVELVGVVHSSGCAQSVMPGRTFSLLNKLMALRLHHPFAGRQIYHR